MSETKIFRQEGSGVTLITVWASKKRRPPTLCQSVSYYLNLYLSLIRPFSVLSWVHGVSFAHSPYFLGHGSIHAPPTPVFWRSGSEGLQGAVSVFGPCALIVRD